MLWLATGLALQFSDALHLEQRFVVAPLLLLPYQLPLVEERSYLAAGRWLSQAGAGLYLDGIALPGLRVTVLGGAVGTADGSLAVVADGGLLLLNRDGALLDRLQPGAGLSDAVSAIARAADGRVVLRGLSGLVVADAEFRLFSAIAAAPLLSAWSVPQAIPVALGTAVRRHAAGRRITWERWLQDAHSGRLFGAAGVAVMTLASLLLLVLAASGATLWLRGRAG